MGKDPAFLFYPGDWLGGTIAFSRHHKGAYMDLLMAQFNLGHLAIEQIKIILGEKDEYLWESVLKSKFSQDSDGKFFNEKLENEILKRKNFIESRNKNLSSHKENHIDSHTENHMEAHMENENIYINNKSITKKDKLKDIENNINNIQKDFPEIDVKYEYGVFVDYLESRDKRYKNYNAAFRNWLRNPSFPKKPLPPKILKNRCPVEKGMTFLNTEKTPACPKCGGKLELYALMEGQLYQEQIYNICWWCPDCGEIFAVAEASYPPEWKERLERENGH